MLAYNPAMMTMPIAKPKPYAEYVVKPHAPGSTYRKHLGYYCPKCKTQKLLTTMKLCDCLVFIEDKKAIKTHINAEWVPIYADMLVRSA